MNEKDDIKELSNEDKIRSAVSELANMVNNMSFPINSIAKIIAEAIRREHRTLQQNIFRLLNQTIIEYSESRFDDRNEASVDFAKKIKELNHYFPNI